MNYNQTLIYEELKAEGEKLWKDSRREYIEFAGKSNREANDLLNDIENYPHIFVLGCIMNRQKDPVKTWEIPWKVSKEIEGAEFSKFYLKREEIPKFFAGGSLHYTYMSDPFCKGIEMIKNKYGDNASKIWSDTPSSSELVSRFMEFFGVGQKISAMAARILVTQFKVPVRDTHCIDVPVDRHILEVFTRIGFVTTKKPQEAILFARGANPDFPGIIDHPCWNLARDICTHKAPNCNACKFNSLCLKNIE